MIDNKIPDSNLQAVFSRILCLTLFLLVILIVFLLSSVVYGNSNETYSNSDETTESQLEEEQIDIEHLDIEITTGGIEHYISVESKFDQIALIPNYEYGASLIVNWGMPNESLSYLTSKRVMIFVEITAKDSIDNITNKTFLDVYFKEKCDKEDEEDEELCKTNKTFVILWCEIVNKSCSNNSKLIEEIPFYIIARERTESISFEGFEIKSSTTPFGPFINLLNETTYANEELKNLEEKINSLKSNWYLTETDSMEYQLEIIEEQLKQIEILINNFKVWGIKDEINDLDTKILELQTEKDLKIQSDSLQETLDNFSQMRINGTEAGVLSVEEKALSSEIESLLDYAESVISDKKFIEAERNIEEARNKLSILMNFEGTEKTSSQKGEYGMLLIGGLAVLVLALILGYSLKKGIDKDRYED